MSRTAAKATRPPFKVPLPIVLPTELHPVALAVRDTTARTWSVVVIPDDGAPELMGSRMANHVAARHLAAVLARFYGEAAVFVVYRSPAGVTVHTCHVGERGNCLGTMPATHAEHPRGTWDRIAAALNASNRLDLLTEVHRRAHGLPDNTPASTVEVYAACEPLPDTAYVTAYVHLIGDAAPLHEHAEQGHRREHTHRRPATD